MYTVYMHTSKTTGKRYVGITCQEPWERRFNGDGSGYKNCIHFWNAIQKYGWSDFMHEVLETCETEPEAMRLEKKYIAQYKTNDPRFGYNIKEGGEHQQYPDEIKENIRNALKGRATKPAGWKHKEETIEKIRKAQKGRPLSPEHAENCRKATRLYYETHSPAHTFNEDDYARAREASKIKVRIVELNITFDSMTECANYLGVLVSNLSRAIRLNKKYKGYHYEKISL